jgi:lysophospholipase L1-like esterase
LVASRKKTLVIAPIPKQYVLQSIMASVFVLFLLGCQSRGTSLVGDAAPPTYTLTYVAVGASDAFGVGTDDPQNESWPSVLANELSDSTHLLNLGIPGATVAEAQQAEVPITLSAHPTVITVWLALNDYAAKVPLATYRAQLAAMLTALRTTGARIYVGNMPDLTLLPFFADRDQAQLGADVVAWNAAINQTVATAGVQLVDIHADFAEVAAHPEYLSDDGLHPSAAGAQRLADYFAAVIRT